MRLVIDRKKQLEIGDYVVCFFHDGEMERTTNMIIGTLTGNICFEEGQVEVDGKSFFLFNEGETMTIMKIGKELRHEK